VLKSGEKVQIWVKSDGNIEPYTWRHFTLPAT